MNTDTSKLAFFPVEYNILNESYQKLKSEFWVPSEIDFSSDRADWDRVDDNTRNFTKQILFLFSQLDGIVNENLIDNFVKETSFLKDASHFYSIQGANETIHNETYSICLETFVKDPIEKARGLNAIAHFPEIKAIADWAYRYMDPSIPLAERVIAFACIEGVIFSSPFAGVFYLRRLGVFKGLTLANEWISRDEGTHTQFAVDLYHILVSDYADKFSRVSKEKAYEIVDSAYQVCATFTRNAMRVDLVGLDVDDMVKYISATADWVLKSFGFPKKYNNDNPLVWMADISLSNKSNFFEKKVTEYSKPADGNFVFDLNVKF